MNVLSVVQRATQHLAFRLALLLAVVLFPFALMIGLKSAEVLRESRSRAEAALLGQTVVATGPQLRLIQETAGAATALAAALPPVLTDMTACRRAVSDFARLQPRFAVVAFVPTDGVMRCASRGAGLDVSKSVGFARLIAAPRPSIQLIPRGRISGLAVLILSQPVFDADGTFLGAVALSVPQSQIDIAADSAIGPPDRDRGTASPAGGRQPFGPEALFSFRRGGAVFALSVPSGQDPAILLPADRTLVDLAAWAGARSMTFSAPDGAGLQRLYAVVPVVPDEIYALGVLGADDARQLSTATPLALPALMWIASLLTAWLAARWLVIQPIRRLSDSMRAFAGGGRSIGAAHGGNPPLELRQITDVYEQLTINVIRNEAELEHAVHQREVLLREVHHRVKNNLQLIASIMNLQIRHARTDEARGVIRDLRERVMSLANVHRELFLTAGVSDIHADELLSAIVAQLAARAANRGAKIELNTQFQPVRLTPDQAVPLALLLTEVLTSLMSDRLAAGDGAMVIDVVLATQDADRACLDIAAPAPSGRAMGPSGPIIDDTATADLGRHLVHGLVHQLGGTIDRFLVDGTNRLQVCFAVSALSNAEARRNQLAD